jgi:pimeloyl-ACP methyl ester carboxylesterase
MSQAGMSASASSSSSAAARRGGMMPARARPPSLILSTSSSRTTVRARALNNVTDEVEVRPGVYQGYWMWRPRTMPGEEHRIRYTRGDGARSSDGTDGTAAPAPPPVVLVHGFGSNADQFRKTTGQLPNPTYAVDLLGYGLSDKPDPRLREPNSLYNFSVWGDLLGDFLDDVVLAPPSSAAPSADETTTTTAPRPTKAFLTANSVGGLAALEAALSRPDAVAGVQVLNISLRGLHVERQPAWQRPLVAAFQRLLRDTSLGEAFFASVAQPQTVKNILRQAYGVKEAVTDELVDLILAPGLQPGAARVFLDFISFSYGPLPERLMAKLPKDIPLSIVWGKEDPWENVVEGKKLFSPYAEEFVELPGVGHCPMDEAPDQVNPLIAAFAARHADKAFVGAEVAAVRV